MQIVDTYECSVHTHYPTDGERMRTSDVQAVERGMKELLSSLGIVYPLRVRSDNERGKIHIVPECRPIKGEADRIRQRLAELLAPLPIRPATTVKIEGGAAGSAAHFALIDRRPVVAVSPGGEDVGAAVVRGGPGAGRAGRPRWAAPYQVPVEAR
jgi:hypothetical protein